jgi:flagellar biosynthesis/type III secretory pathway protein FliH
MLSDWDNDTFLRAVQMREDTIREEKSALNSAREQGRTQAAREIALELFRLDLTLEQISMATKLDIKEVQKLKDDYDEGFAIGLAEGLAIGKAEAKRERAIQMLKFDFNLEQISTITELDIKEIEKLKKNLK